MRRGTRRPRAPWNAGTVSSRPRSCPADTSSPRPTSITSSRRGCDGERAHGAHDQGPPGRSGRGRQGSHAAVAAGGCCTWVGVTTSGSGGTTTCGSTPATTPSILRRSGRVDVTADLEKVRVRHGGRLVAEHDRRWARGMTVTDPAHVHAAACYGGPSKAETRYPSATRSWNRCTWPTTTEPSASTLAACRDSQTTARPAARPPRP